MLAEQYILPDDQYPESGAYDPVGHAFFVASLMYGDVLRVEADGGQSIFYPGTGEPDRLTLGMKVDAERRRLWVCSIVNDNEKPGDMWVLDADTGMLLADFALGDTFAGASISARSDRDLRAVRRDERARPTPQLLPLRAGGSRADTGAIEACRGGLPLATPRACPRKSCVVA